MTKQTPGGQTIGDKIAGRLATEMQNVVAAATDKMVSMAADRIGSATDRLTEYATKGGGPGLVAAVTGAQKLADGKSPAKAGMSAAMAGIKEKVKAAFGKGGKGGGKNKIKVTNIVESIDVGVPVRVAYNQWTQYEAFPSFMKKVENVDREGDEKTTWKAQVFWSHRTWEATVIEQVPDERIVWKSKGEKGHVDGTVSFHELAPDLTRILVVLEYHPQGLFEKTGNIWRAQGRRARLELKHFVRHVMTQTVLDPDQVEGWRGEIRDGEVVRDHETALAEERDQHERDDQHDDDQQDDDAADRDDDRYQADDGLADRDADDRDQDDQDRVSRDDRDADDRDRDDRDDEGAGTGRQNRPQRRTQQRGRSRNQGVDRR